MSCRQELGESTYKDHSKDTEEMKVAAAKEQTDYASFLFNVSFDPLN